MCAKVAVSSSARNGKRMPMSDARRCRAASEASGLWDLPLWSRAMTTSKPLWLLAAPVIFLLLWSGGFPIAKLGISHAEPMSFLSLRYALVLVAWAALGAARC